jgi:hypothetical protein
MFIERGEGKLADAVTLAFDTPLVVRRRPIRKDTDAVAAAHCESGEVGHSCAARAGVTLASTTEERR